MSEVGKSAPTEKDMSKTPEFTRGEEAALYCIKDMVSGFIKDNDHEIMDSAVIVAKLCSEGKADTSDHSSALRRFNEENGNRWYAPTAEKSSLRNSSYTGDDSSLRGKDGG